MTVRPAKKTLLDITREWDTLAPLRLRQLQSGQDWTYSHVLSPTILSLCGGSLAGSSVVDIGCGIGSLTRTLAELASHVVGIDPSVRSVALARSTAGAMPNLEFCASTIEAFADRRPQHTFHIAVANMTLMDCLDLPAVLRATRRLLRNRGSLVATITHPWHWPKYWGYQDAPWFEYTKELVIEAPFRITAETTAHVSTHVHRPLQAYVDAVRDAGLSLTHLTEPMPPLDMPGPSWSFPRYLAFRATSGRTR